MKSLWKLLFVFPLFLIAACNETGPSTGEVDTGHGISQGTIAEENSNQASAKPEITLVPSNPTVEIAKFPIDLEPAFLDHAKFLNSDWNILSSAQQLDRVQNLKVQWTQQMGELNPGTMKMNSENIDKFLQFVRVAGGDDFMVKNEMSAVVNHTAHTRLFEMIEAESSADLSDFLNQLSLQVTVNNQLRVHLLKVAHIYSMPFGAAVPTVEERQNFSEGLGDYMKERLLLDDTQTASVKMRLTDVLRSTIIVLKGREMNFCYLSFNPSGDGLEIGNESKGYPVLDRIYGFIPANSNRFLTR